MKLLASIGWRREDVFITNVVKCRPPENRDPLPDEIAACAPFLERQLRVLDPAVVVTLGRYSMGRFMPGARISSAHGTVRQIDPATGASNALAFAMYHPAAALRSTSVERDSYADIASVPIALLDARARRAASAAEVADQPDHRTDGRLDATRRRARARARPGAGARPRAGADLDRDDAFADVGGPSRLHAFNEIADLESLTTVALTDTSSDEPTPQLTLF